MMSLRTGRVACWVPSRDDVTLRYGCAGMIPLIRTAQTNLQSVALGNLVQNLIYSVKYATNRISNDAF